MAKVKGARKPRQENAESQRDEMTDIQSDPSHSPIPTPRIPTARPPSKAKKFNANTPDRRSAKLTEAQQDPMFDSLEQTSSIYEDECKQISTNVLQSLQMPCHQ